MAQTVPDIPRAPKIRRELIQHGDVRIDEYYWLNQRDDPAVVRYLNEENEYTAAQLADVKELRRRLFDEIVSRIKQDDQSVPYLDRGYYYYVRFNEGQQYPLYCRRAEQPGADEQILLDVNQLAEGQPFCQVVGVRVSPNSQLLAYAVDFVGRRQFTIRIKNLNSQQHLPDEIPGVNGSLEWADDNATVFYTENDPQTLRSYLIKRHVLGSPCHEDVVMYEERDEEFDCRIGKSRSREFIFITSAQTLSTEVRMLRADDPQGQFVVFCPRRDKHEYSVNHLNGEFLIRSNWDAPNFRLFRCDDQDFQQSAWKEWIPHREDTLLESFVPFRGNLVLSERRNALTHLRIVSWDGNGDAEIPFDEPAYVASLAPTPDPDSPWLRYRYTSLTTPGSLFEYNMQTGEQKLLKRDPVLGGFDPQDYRTERQWATARDGTPIPVSIVYRKTTRIDASAPCLQYAYGSYGSSVDPRFNSALLSLLDRGFVYAIAHVRGGQEMGRQWYEDGKLLNKMNTFTDFIDVGRFLIEQGYAAPDRLYARGGSAGGLLMGAVINLAPELYHGVVADVPFVDVVTTMLDDTIPLTTFEYDEWGNPNDRTHYEYMLSYSPYDNVDAKPYPNLLVTTGLHDSQVQYWEPAKWVARLRDHWQGSNLLLLKTNMDAGHGGASGRFERYRDVALRYAFLLKLVGIQQ